MATTEPTVIRLDAAHLTVEPPPGLGYPDPAVALASFPGGDRIAVLCGSLGDLRDVAWSILGMLDDLACTCEPGAISPDCPTHGDD